MRIGLIITLFIGVVVAIAVMPIVFASFNDLNMQTVEACELVGGTEERFRSVNTDRNWKGTTHTLSRNSAGLCEDSGVSAVTDVYTPNGVPVQFDASGVIGDGTGIPGRAAYAGIVGTDWPIGVNWPKNPATLQAWVEVASGAGTNSDYNLWVFGQTTNGLSTCYIQGPGDAAPRTRNTSNTTPDTNNEGTDAYAKDGSGDVFSPRTGCWGTNPATPSVAIAGRIRTKSIANAQFKVAQAAVSGPSVATWQSPLAVVEKQNTLNRLIISVLPVILVAGGLAVVGMWIYRTGGVRG